MLIGNPLNGGAEAAAGKIVDVAAETEEIEHGREEILELGDGRHPAAGVFGSGRRIMNGTFMISL